MDFQALLERKHNLSRIFTKISLLVDEYFAGFEGTKTIGIVGSRSFSVRDEVKRFVSSYVPLEDVRFVTGCAKSGMDKHCRDAVEHVLEFVPQDHMFDIDEFLTVHTADWDKYKKRAGPIRNGVLVEDLRDSNGIMIAAGFVDECGELTPGTDDVTSKARKAHVPLILVTCTKTYEDFHLMLSKDFTNGRAHK